MAAPSSSLLRGDTAAGLVAAAFGLGYTVVALGIPADTSETSVVGPAVFPLLFGALMLIGGLALAATGLRTAQRTTGRSEGAAPAAPSPPAVDADAAPPTVRAKRSLSVLLAMLVGYVVLFIPLGYLLSTAVFLMSLMTYLNRRRVLTNLLFSVLFPVAVYLLFGFALRVTLPAGILSGVLP